jgi:predicted DNA-binding transcriptional regulator AlpA
MKPKRFLSDRQLAKRYGVSRATCWNWVKGGKFPKPRRLGPNTTRWDLDEIERFEAQQGGAA